MGIGDRWKSLPRWRRFGFFLSIIFFIVPYLILLLYPPSTGIVLAYFTSPPMTVVWIALIILVWASLFWKYHPR
jgi:hypothetical protein